VLTLQLAQASASIFIRIKDNLNGVTEFYIPSTVTVTIDETAFKNTLSSLISKESANSGLISGLQNGDVNQVASTVISLVATLDTIVYTAASNSTDEINQRSEAKASLLTYLSSLPLSSISNLKVMTSAMSVLTNKYQENSQETTVSAEIKS
jgi:hypothetical protein